MKTVFIVDMYNPYSPYNADVRAIAKVKDRWLCVREVQMNWGKPNIGISFDDNPPEPEDFYIYNTFEEANEFMQELKRINR